MLKKAITYKNVFTGEPITETFYFNLNEADMVELEISDRKGLSERLKTIMESQDLEAIYTIFKKIVLKAYGQKGADGKSFIRNQELRDEFESTNAYSALLMEMMQVEGAFDQFVAAVFPAELMGNTNQMALAVTPPPPGQQFMTSSTDHPEPIAPKKLTVHEIAEMDADELKAGLSSGRFTL